jgi:hypothetical protein
MVEIGLTERLASKPCMGHHTIRVRVSTQVLMLSSQLYKALGDRRSLVGARDMRRVRLRGQGHPRHAGTAAASTWAGYGADCSHARMFADAYNARAAAAGNGKPGGGGRPAGGIAGVRCKLV